MDTPGDIVEQYRGDGQAPLQCRHTDQADIVDPVDITFQPDQILGLGQFQRRTAYFLIRFGDGLTHIGQGQVIAA